MILTNCAACAAPLAHDAPRCVRCWTRYCDSTCQQDHWRRGHKQECKKIFRGGGAEKYHANEKYKELEKKAVEKCAAATQLRLARRALGPDHAHVLSLSEDLATAVLYDDRSTAQEKLDAEASLVKTIEAMRRVHGPESDEAKHAQEVLEYSRNPYEEDA